MPARLEKLRAALTELEQELSGLDALDAPTRAMLEEARHEIETALSKQDPAQIEHVSLVDRLETAAETFQVSHPTLAGVVQRMIDALGQMGI